MPKKLESDGRRYPAAAYAYTPNMRDCATWKWRLWDQTGLNSALIQEAAEADLTAIPEEHREAVHSKITNAKQKLGSQASECSIIEQNMVEGLSDSGVATVVVIRPGFNASRARFYPPDVLKRDAHIFEGAKMFADHQSQEESRHYPVGRIRDWMGVLRNVRVREEDGAVIGEGHVIDDSLRSKMRNLKEAGLLNELGVSIKALGQTVSREVQGAKTMVVEAINRCFSVDYVTEPGAGGGVLMYESDEQPSLHDLDLDTLKRERPDLVEQLTADGEKPMLTIEELAAKIAAQETEVGALKTGLKEAKESIAAIGTERDELKAKLAEAESREKARDVKQSIVEALDAHKPELPKEVKARIVERLGSPAEFKAEVVEAAIKAEEQYIAALSEAGRVRGLGPTIASDPKVDEADTKELREALVDSYIGQGMTKEEAERLAEIASR